MIEQFKTIAPELYHVIDTIQDKKGRPVDVYIQFVPFQGTERKAFGSTYFDQMDGDEDMAISEFGKSSVSIKVWTVHQALFVLAHEFGHISYQIPNLASYVNYYRERYRSKSNDRYSIIGHSEDDPSGKSALEFDSRFRKQYIKYLKLAKHKIDTPRIVLSKIKNELKEEWGSSP